MQRQIFDDDGEPLPVPVRTASSAYADLQALPETCTSLHQRAIFIKQIESLGAFSWIRHDACELDDTAEVVKKKCGHLHFEVWLWGTDAGGDQTARNKTLPPPAPSILSGGSCGWRGGGPAGRSGSLWVR